MIEPVAYLVRPEKSERFRALKGRLGRAKHRCDDVWRLVEGRWRGDFGPAVPLDWPNVVGGSLDTIRAADLLSARGRNPGTFSGVLVRALREAGFTFDARPLHVIEQSVDDGWRTGREASDEVFLCPPPRIGVDWLRSSIQHHDRFPARMVSAKHVVLVVDADALPPYFFVRGLSLYCSAAAAPVFENARNASLEPSNLHDRHEGQTALMAAVEEGSITGVSAKLADVNAADSFGFTALHWAGDRTTARQDPSGDVERIVRAIVAAGGEVDATTRRGITPAMVAAHHGRVDALAALHRAGADLTALDEDGLGAVQWALIGRQTAAVVWLLSMAIRKRRNLTGLGFRDGERLAA